MFTVLSLQPSEQLRSKNAQTPGKTGHHQGPEDEARHYESQPCTVFRTSASILVQFAGDGRPNDLERLLPIVCAGQNGSEWKRQLIGRTPFPERAVKRRTGTRRIATNACRNESSIPQSARSAASQGGSRERSRSTAATPSRPMPAAPGDGLAALLRATSRCRVASWPHTVRDAGALLTAAPASPCDDFTQLATSTPGSIAGMWQASTAVEKR
jgi:hypothetical protein